MNSHSGMVFDIQRFSVHDGPGIRTTVFLKGCPLSCAWCHNPEGKCASPQIMLNDEKCIGCGKCRSACNHSVHAFDDQGRRWLRPQYCIGCGTCAEICPSEALKLVGRRMSAEKVMEIVRGDRAFYGTDGGMSVSGGEAFMQSTFLNELLQAAHAEGMNTAVDTSGYAKWEAIEATLPYTDLYLYDIKAYTSGLHRALTGVDNALILDNLRRLDASDARIWIRMPIIRGKNDDEAELSGVARLLSELRNIERIDMLPYHVLGRAKYEMLGMTGQQCFFAPTDEEMKAHHKLFARYGLKVN